MDPVALRLALKRNNFFAKLAHPNKNFCRGWYTAVVGVLKNNSFGQIQ
jgi:hypothetical protein